MRKTFSLPVAATAAGGGVTPPPADTVDNIEHSVRFNSADSAYMSRTPSSAGNRKTWTWSGWVKRGTLNGIRQTVFGCTISNSDYSILEFDANDSLTYYESGASGGTSRVTTAVYRDPSAWYHIVLAVDTTQGTAPNRQKLYVNGVEVTDFSTSVDITQNYDTRINDTQVQDIGRAGTFGLYFDGYLANIELIDGLQLTPSSFGFTDSNGVWQPKAYTGSYGTNGFHLDFADTSSATALGNDVSGNNNDWTPSGLVAGPAYTANSFSTEFDGTGDYIDNTSNYLISSTTSTFTVESWIYMTADPTNDTRNIPGLITVNSGGGASTTNYMAFGPISTKKLRLRWYDGASKHAEGSTTLALNTWYHVACSVNSNGIKFFVNGVEETLTGTTTLTNRSNDETGFAIGQSYTYASYTGRISNLRVIDGRALYTAAFTPPSTALTAVTDTVLLTCQDSTFIDNSPSAHTITANGDAATTTVSPFEPVDGSDAMLDSPTNYGSGDTVRGNYCTLNPLDKASNITLSDGNLKTAAPSGNAWQNSRATFAISSGKWYWETTLLSGIELLVGLLKSEASLDLYIGNDTNGWGYSANGGWIWHNGTNSTYGASIGTNDVAGIAFDADNGTLVFYKNGVSQGTAFTGLTSGPYFPAVSNYDSSSGLTNFGQQPFKYPAPAGYKSLCSTNLPTPTIADGSTAMDVVTYTGNGSTQTISGLGFSPDLVWIKSRGGTNGAYHHRLFDVLRTVGGYLRPLYSSLTDAETAYAPYDALQITTNDFLLTSNGSGGVDGTGGINASSTSYVAWTWDAGSSTVSNTDGSITSTVRANPSAGFSIVSYTGTGSAVTIGHELNAKPVLNIIKRTTASTDWVVYTDIVDGSWDYLLLNTTNAKTDTSVFSAGTSTFNFSGASTVANTSGGAAIAYCFAPVEGFSAFGSYTGNGSTDGPFVYTGFRPRWIMIKSSSIGGAAGYDWIVHDTARSDYNLSATQLIANSSVQENQDSSGSSTAGVGWDILSNGFKLRTSTGGRNQSSQTYIYAAFAEHPFKTSRAR